MNEANIVAHYERVRSDYKKNAFDLMKVVSNWTAGDNKAAECVKANSSRKTPTLNEAITDLTSDLPVYEWGDVIQTQAFSLNWSE